MILAGRVWYEGSFQTEVSRVEAHAVTSMAIKINKANGLRKARIILYSFSVQGQFKQTEDHSSAQSIRRFTMPIYTSHAHSECDPGWQYHRYLPMNANPPDLMDTDLAGDNCFPFKFTGSRNM
jgi:hypothetical protein